MHFAARHLRGNPLRRSPVTVALVLAVFIFTALAVLCKCPRLLMLSPDSMQKAQFWTLLTYPFVQFGLAPFVINCISLLILGSIVEKEWRGRQMIILLACTTLLTGVSWLFIAKAFGSDESLGGTIAIFYALITVTAIIKRGERINLYGLAEMSFSTLCVIIIAVTIIINFNSFAALTTVTAVLWAFLFTKIAGGGFRRTRTRKTPPDNPMNRFSDLD